jgi:hypothetical protein
MAGTKGWQMWSGAGGLFDASQKTVGSVPSSDNFTIWWGADLTRFLLNGTSISPYSGGGTGLNASGCTSNNTSKSTPALTADIFGDWREEVVFRTTGNDALRIYTTTTPTTKRLYTLMHDPIYRMSVATENVAYNQPPEPGIYIGPNMTLPEAKPNIKYYSPGSISTGGSGGATSSGGSGGTTSSGGLGGTTSSGGSGGSNGTTGGATSGTVGGRGGTTGGATGGTTGSRGGMSGGTTAAGGTMGGGGGTNGGTTGGTVTTSGTGGAAGTVTAAGGAGGTVTTNGPGGAGGTVTTSGSGGAASTPTSTTSASGGSTKTGGTSAGSGTSASSAGGLAGSAGTTATTGATHAAGNSGCGCRLAGVDRSTAPWGVTLVLGAVVAGKLRRRVMRRRRS